LSTPFRLLLSRDLYLALITQARAELPNECCGLLAGRILEADADGPRRALAVGRFPLVNAAASPVEFLSDARSMLDAVRAIDRHGLDILAVYHSHPSSDPVPSRKDREQNYSPDVMNLILSLKAAEPLLRGWWLAGEEFLEAEWELVEVIAPRRLADSSGET
jgi:proteasome lid subunit RPN8/RPN11